MGEVKLFDGVEDVGVSVLLPFGEIVPVGYVTWLGVGDVFVNLRDPAGSDEPAALFAGEFGRIAVAGFDEGCNLVVDGFGAGAFPAGGVLPRCDVAGFGFAWVVLDDSGDPGFAEDSALL